MFKHILCPTDMGERAYFALKKLSKLHINIKDFVAGTITANIINNAGCPVLVIPFKNRG